MKAWTIQKRHILPPPPPLILPNHNPAEPLVLWAAPELRIVVHQVSVQLAYNLPTNQNVGSKNMWLVVEHNEAKIREVRC